MSWFGRIEETCAAFIERAFAVVFPSDLEPAQIARKLVATMEARTHREEGAMMAPGRYDVFVHPADFERLSVHRAYLEEEWALLLADVAERVGIAFAGSPRVALHAGSDMVAGAVDVEASYDSDAEPAQPVHRRFVLRVREGMPAGGQFVVSGATRVGRNRECEIFLVDPSVSRTHALLDVRDGNLIVRDAGSTNGTFVNGTRVQLRTVQPGETIAFGKTQLLVEAAP